MAANMRRISVESGKFLQRCLFSRRIKSPCLKLRCLNTAQSSEETTHFGFETVTEGEKTEKGKELIVSTLILSL